MAHNTFFVEYLDIRYECLYPKFYNLCNLAVVLIPKYLYVQLFVAYDSSYGTLQPLMRSDKQAASTHDNWLSRSSFHLLDHHGPSVRAAWAFWRARNQWRFGCSRDVIHLTGGSDRTSENDSDSSSWSWEKVACLSRVTWIVFYLGNT